MAKTTSNEIRARVVIRRVMKPQWENIGDAAELLGVSGTQVRRHVTGREYSKTLARRMKEFGVVVEAE